MIYIDSSVVLAQLLDEERAPPEWLWDEDLVASRLLEYEVWNRAHAYDQAARLAEDITTTLRLVLLMEMEPPVLSRALELIPGSPRTLDALHLATACFIRAGHPGVRLASYDRRLQASAAALGIPLAQLD
jgi:predicted nucleic acid-binding protein